MAEGKQMQHISLTVQGKNETLSGYINVSLDREPAKPYDETGAAYYVIAVVLVYGLSMVLLIGSLAKKNMKNKSADHDDRQVSRYLENVPTLKELSARQQFKELKHNIITLVSSKTPVGELSALNSSSGSNGRGTSPQPAGMGGKKVSFSSENENSNKYNSDKRVNMYIGSREVIGGDAYGSEHSPLLGYSSPTVSPIVGYSNKIRRLSDSILYGSDSECESPRLKPKLKYKSSWGETRIYQKKSQSFSNNYSYESSTEDSPRVKRSGADKLSLNGDCYFMDENSLIIQANTSTGTRKVILKSNKGSKTTTNDTAKANPNLITSSPQFHKRTSLLHQCQNTGPSKSSLFDNSSVENGLSVFKFNSQISSLSNQLQNTDSVLQPNKQNQVNREGSTQQSFRGLPFVGHHTISPEQGVCRFSEFPDHRSTVTAGSTVYRHDNVVIHKGHDDGDLLQVTTV